MKYRYRDAVVAQLWQHGIDAKRSTRPEMVRAFVNDLYRYELRRLRDRLLRGEIPKAGYYDRVVALRLRYPLLSIQLHSWLES